MLLLVIMDRLILLLTLEVHLSEEFVFFSLLLGVMIFIYLKENFTGGIVSSLY